MLGLWSFLRKMQPFIFPSCCYKKRKLCHTRKHSCHPHRRLCDAYLLKKKDQCRMFAIKLYEFKKEKICKFLQIKKLYFWYFVQSTFSVTFSSHTLYLQPLSCPPDWQRPSFPKSEEWAEVPARELFQMPSLPAERSPLGFACSCRCPV
jgi:hypothetical protein